MFRLHVRKMEGTQALFMLLIGIALTIYETSATEVCSYYPEYRYCDDGYYCCDENRCCSETALAVGAIIGIVIGCIIFVSLCVGVCICIVQSQKRTRGQVIQPATGAQTIAVVGMQNQQQQLQYQPQYQPYPVQGNQAHQPPPAYNPNLYSQPGQAGPAYPPVQSVNMQQATESAIPTKG